MNDVLPTACHGVRIWVDAHARNGPKVRVEGTDARTLHLATVLTPNACKCTDTYLKTLVWQVRMVRQSRRMVTRESFVIGGMPHEVRWMRFRMHAHLHRVELDSYTMIRAYATMALYVYLRRHGALSHTCVPVIVQRYNAVGVVWWKIDSNSFATPEFARELAGYWPVTHYMRERYGVQGSM